MKNKNLAILLILILIIFSNSILYAHKGRTDESGGHYDRSTGEYHYHHGYSAHQHPNGICPYDTDTDVEFQDNSTKTDKIENTSNTSSTQNIQNPELNENKAKNEDTKKNTSSNILTNYTTHLLTDEECNFFTIGTYILCILIGILICYIHKNSNKYLQWLIFILSIILTPLLIGYTLNSKIEIFNSFKNNSIEGIVFPCVGIIAVIVAIYCIFKYYKNE